MLLVQGNQSCQPPSRSPVKQLEAPILEIESSGDVYAKNSNTVAHTQAQAVNINCVTS